MLFDLEADPYQEKPIENSQAEKKMLEYMIELMEQNDAPQEQYERLGLK